MSADTHVCKNILIVEDDEGIREALRMYLEFEGYQIHEACNGKEALEIVRSSDHLCLILLDLMMPIMDGWKFAESLESDGKFSHIPIVVCTAFSDHGNVINALAHLNKPVNMAVLLEIVQKHCA